MSRGSVGCGAYSGDPSGDCLLQRNPEWCLSNEMINSVHHPLTQSSENNRHNERGQNKYRLRSCNYYLVFLKTETTSVQLNLIILPCFHSLDIPFTLKGQNGTFNQHGAMTYSSMIH